MARKEPQSNEVNFWLSRLDVNCLESLMALNNNKALAEQLFRVFEIIKRSDDDIIIRTAGGVHNMDGMIDTAVEQSFRRGRISLSVLFRSMVLNAEKEANKREKNKK